MNRITYRWPERRRCSAGSPDRRTGRANKTESLRQTGPPQVPAQEFFARSNGDFSLRRGRQRQNWTWQNRGVKASAAARRRQRRLPDGCDCASSRGRSQTRDSMRSHGPTPHLRRIQRANSSVRLETPKWTKIVAPSQTKRTATRDCQDRQLSGIRGMDSISGRGLGLPFILVGRSALPS